MRDHDMARQFMERQKTDHPNPISVLWENQRDGQAHTWPEGHTASFALRLPISREMHQRVKTQVALYDFSRFSVAHNQCTDLVAQCAAVVGLPLQYRVLLTFAPTHRAYGRDLRFWTDPEYQTVNMGSPDLLEASLRHLQGRGIGQASTALINKIIEQTPHTTENWLPYVKRNP